MLVAQQLGQRDLVVKAMKLIPCLAPVYDHLSGAPIFSADVDPAVKGLSGFCGLTGAGGLSILPGYKGGGSESETTSGAWCD